MGWTRRELLRAGATTAATVLVAPTALLRAPDARAAGAEPVLVSLVLRGGADCLSLVPPVGDSQYYALRPQLAVARRDAIDLDGFFGFHPALQPLRKHYDAGRLAVVHAFGSPHSTRSHFDAQDYLESAVPGSRSTASGWLGRYAARAGLSEPWAALTLSSRPARSIAGARASLALSSIDKFVLSPAWDSGRRETLQRIVAATGGEWKRTWDHTNAALGTIDAVPRSVRARWPSGSLADALRDLALLIRARIGVRVAAVDMTGWDHHVDLARRLPESARTLAEALDAFAVELGSELDRTVVLVTTEFGRRAAENGSGGTEHGRGGVLLAFGGPVRGGRVWLQGGRWPGLAASQLVDGRDLAVTTDYRDAYAEVLYRHMRLNDVAPVFPSHTVASSRFPGVIG